MEGIVEMVSADECLDHPLEAEFDEFPKAFPGKGEVESLPIRASFIPGLLNLSEVDLILRGKFKPPFEETTRSEFGGSFSNINASGAKKVSFSGRFSGSCIASTTNENFQYSGSVFE
jgi:hypothetical protein